MVLSETVGIVGGSGQLGSAIAHGLLRTACIEAGQLVISNRSGTTAGFEDWPGIQFTTDNQQLAEASEIIILSVPPQTVSEMAISVGDQLVISVMAGVTVSRIAELTGATRIVRAMSSPAAERSLAYSPWCTSDGLSDADKARVTTLFAACGLTDEVSNEDQIDHFTAMTGPVPGFVAYFADCMVRHAVSEGIDPAIANRAIRQLFLASGTMLSQSDTTPAEQVQAMIDYAGTTAAGLKNMQASPLSDAISVGLKAAYDSAKTIA